MTERDRTILQGKDIHHVVSEHISLSDFQNCMEYNNIGIVLTV